LYDIIIIGAGPSGLTSSIYCARENKKVLVIEKNIYGGQIISSPMIGNYPGFIQIDGVEFANKLYEQAKYLNVDFVYEKVVDIVDNFVKEVVTDKNVYKAKSIIIATGMDNRKTGIENENKYIGKGISYCATCDGALYKDKDVAIIGSGNTALESCLFLSKYCKNVYLISRSDSFKGEQSTLESIKKLSNVVILTQKSVTDFCGNEQLEYIVLNNDEKLKIDGVFIAIGKIPNTHDFNEIKKDGNNFISAGENCHTNIDGIFVAGDCRSKKVRQLTTAASDGTIAALEACKYIYKNFKEDDYANNK